VAPIERALYERQLRHLSRCYAIVPLAELPAAVNARRRGQRHPVSVTFDDDAPEHVVHALPALREHGVRATFFLSGSWADPGRPQPWWHDLQRAADAGRAPSGRALFRSAYEIARLEPAARDAEARRVRELAGPGAVSLISEDQVSELVGAGQSIGFHTRHHYSLPVLGDGELEAALSELRPEIEAVAGPLTQFSYPHGDFDDRTVAAVRANGFAIGVTCLRTSVTPGTDPLLLGRVEIKGASLGEFIVQVVRGLLAPG
jgi:peptidoglycan/xylan/chitin deacetylase (PgdA/CDA1 family)